MEPFLRLGESLIIAQVHGDHDRDMIDEFPVVIRVRLAEMCLDDCLIDCRRRRVRERVIRVWLLKSAQEARIQHAGYRCVIELSDEVFEEGMSKSLELVGEVVRGCTLPEVPASDICAAIPRYQGV